MFICSYRLKSEVASKNGLSTQPRLVDIIAAVPPSHRKALLPKLKVNLNWCITCICVA